VSSDPSQRSEILGWLRSKNDRRQAFEALERLPPEQRTRCIDPSVATELVRMLDDPSRTRQREVADVLLPWVATTPALEKALRTALAALEPRLRWGAAYTLGHALPPPPAELWPIVRETLALEDGDQRWAAAELTCSLARAHRSVRDQIIAAVDSGSASVRRMLLYCLRDLGDEDLASVALRRIADEDPGVRLAALSAATHCPADGDLDLGGEIARRVEEDPEPGVRRAAAVALSKLASPPTQAREVLERASRSPDTAMIRAARAGLARLDDPNRRN
jgi:HEAT repeat protein